VNWNTIYKHLYKWAVFTRIS